jgi:hypothetical protein
MQLLILLYQLSYSFFFNIYKKKPTFSYLKVAESNYIHVKSKNYSILPGANC